MSGNGIVDMMGGLSELGMLLIGGFAAAFVLIPLLNWLNKKRRNK